MSTQKIDLSIVLVTLVYPILDAVVIFPTVLIFWAARRVRKPGQKSKEEETKSSFSYSIFYYFFNLDLLLSISMVLSAIGDIGFAYSTAMGPEIVLRDIWIWNIFYNADHLCLAAALIGYRHFFSSNKIDKLQR